MSNKNKEIRKFIAQEEQRKNPCSGDIKFGKISTFATSEYEVKDSQVSANSDGSFFAIWKLFKIKTLGLVGQYFNSDNAPIGDQIDITTHRFIGTIGAKTFSTNKDVLVTWSTLATSSSNWKIHLRYYKYHESNNSFEIKYTETPLEAVKDEKGRDSKGEFSFVSYQDDVLITTFPNSTHIDTIRYRPTEDSLENIAPKITESFCSKGMNKITSTVSLNGTLAVAWSAKKTIHAQHYNLLDGSSIGSRIKIPAIPKKLFIDKTNATTVVGWQSGKLSECQGLLQSNLLHYAQVFTNNGTTLSNIVNISVNEFETLNQLHQITDTAFGAAFTVGNTEEQYAIQRLFLNNGTFVTSNNILIKPTNTTGASASAKHMFQAQSVDPIAPFLAYTTILAISRGTQYVLYEMESTTVQVNSNLDNTIDHDNNQCTLNCNARLQNIKDTIGIDSDPVVIDSTITNAITIYLNWCKSLELSYDNKININSGFIWEKNDLTIKSKHDITIGDSVIISNLGKGTLKLMAGIESDDHNATVNFASTAGIVSPNSGIVKIYYNPIVGNTKHKFVNPQDVYSHVYPTSSLISFMFVNHIGDLQDIQYRLYGNFALSNNIEGNTEVPFSPIGNHSRAFSGRFDGLGYEISNLNIQGTNKLAIFGLALGTLYKKVDIGFFSLKNIQILGNSYLGVVVSQGQFVELHNIVFKSSINISGFSIIGPVIGSGSGVTIRDIVYQAPLTVNGEEFFGQVAGALRESEVELQGLCDTNCIGFIAETINV